MKLIIKCNTFCKCIFYTHVRKFLKSPPPNNVFSPTNSLVPRMNDQKIRQVLHFLVINEIVGNSMQCIPSITNKNVYHHLIWCKWQHGRPKCFTFVIQNLSNYGSKVQWLAWMWKTIHFLNLRTCNQEMPQNTSPILFHELWNHQDIQIDVGRSMYMATCSTRMPRQ
jgi:hypothetical protein